MFHSKRKQENCLRVSKSCQSKVEADLRCTVLHCIGADSALLTMIRKVHAQEWRQQFAETQVLILDSKSDNVQIFLLQLTLCRPLPSLSYQLPCRDSTSAAVQCSTRGLRLSRVKVKTRFAVIGRTVLRKYRRQLQHQRYHRKHSPSKMYTSATYQA